MNNLLAAAAAAAAYDEAPTNEFGYLDGGPDAYKIMWLGVIALFVVCPFVAGLIHGRQWRTLLVWVAVLGSASLVLQAGQFLMESQLLRAEIDILDALFFAAIATLAPALVAATAGVSLRKIFTWATAKAAGSETA